MFLLPYWVRKNVKFSQRFIIAQKLAFRLKGFPQKEILIDSIFWPWVPARKAPALVFGEDHYQFQLRKQIPTGAGVGSGLFCCSFTPGYLSLYLQLSLGYEVRSSVVFLFQSRNCSGTTVSPCWGHRALPWSFPGWVQSSPDLWLVWFSSFPHFVQNQWIPLAHGRRCRGLSLLFLWGLCLNVLAARGGIQNLTPVSHVELEFCLPCFNSFSKADFQLSNS